MHSQGNENNTPKLIPMRPVKNSPACNGEISPVVKGLAFVLSTCLSMSLSKKSFIIQPADRHDKAPRVNKDISLKLGRIAGLPKANPQ